MYNNAYLLDYDFLKSLGQENNKNIRVRITSLTWEEAPIETIEGQVTSGSINIDGNSAVRRTCSLSMVAKDIDINAFYQGLNTKFRIEIGIENQINKKYPDIIWIPQGIFILTAFNSSISVNNYTLTLSGKDKMCLLNGDVSGTLGASIDFGVEEIVNKDNTITYKHILLKDIIYNIVKIYGQEFPERIFVNDLDMYGYSLMKYRGGNDFPLYLLINNKDNSISNIVIDQEFKVLIGGKPFKISDDQNIVYALGVESQINLIPTVITLPNGDGSGYIIRRVLNEDTAGYRYTDLTYAGELIAKPGESITSILDKIVKMLGNYEYFYNVNGQFIFQKKKNNLYNNWIPFVENDGENNKKENYIDPSLSAIDHTFYSTSTFVSISHNPDFVGIKNDYSIWGERESVSGVKVPIHLRYAIHRKPTEYINYNKTKFSTNDYDWRELIYRMAEDYFAHGTEENFNYELRKNNPELCADGRTGYEMFYTDLFSFWRELYNPDFIKVGSEEPSGELTYYLKVSDKKNQYESIKGVKVKDWPQKDGVYIKLFNENGYEHVIGESPKFNTNKLYFTEDGLSYNIYEWDKSEGKDIYYRGNDSRNFGLGDEIYGFWNKNVYNSPTSLNFWFDFLGENTALEQYSILAIGDRTKVINDNDVSAIYFKETPDVLLKYGEEDIQPSDGYTIISIPTYLTNAFSVSSRKKSAFEVLEQALYENTQSKESVNINAIPVYYLQPNTRIGISDDINNLHGEFILSKITLPLTYNGNMSLTATRVVDTIY